MSAYEIIKEMDKSVLSKLIDCGVMKSTTERDMQIYEYYMSVCGEGKMMARTLTSEKFGISEDWISKIIKRMR